MKIEGRLIKMTTQRSAAALVVVASFLPAYIAQAADTAITLESYTHVVDNAEKSTAFYRDVIGLEVASPLGPFRTVPEINLLGDTAGAQLRTATFNIPGSPLIFEIAEYKDVDRKSVRPRYQDPGVTCVIFFVRDLDSMIEKINKTDARIVTVGGAESLPKSAAIRALFLQDPDGFFFGLSQHAPVPETSAPATSNVIGEELEFTTADIAESARFYNIIGVPTRPPSPFRLNEGINKGGNTLGAQMRMTGGRLPGRTGNPLFGNLVLLEYKDIDRTAVRNRIQDPGTTIMRMSIRDLATTTQRLRDAGFTLIPKNGEPVKGREGIYLVTRNPDSLYVDLVQHP